MTRIDAGKSVLSANDAQALRNFERWSSTGLVAVNVMASPGAGKTSVIAGLLARLPKQLRNGVIEGDVASSLDTDKLIAMGFRATQINTNGACHLDASMVSSAIEALGVAGPGFVFIENIGNLICPVDFKLGESVRLAIASVPEGDDKPVKYPGIFAAVDAIVLNKTDLLGHVDFKMDFFTRGVRAVNSTAEMFNVSCKTGEGLQAVADWLVARRG
ncbi:MAG: hydrogenase nickel incorporation protein HypB [Phycisphaerae bacterium]